MADGSLIFDTAIDTKGFNNGTKDITTSANKLSGAFKGLGGAAVGAAKTIGVGVAAAAATGTAAIVGFGAKGVQLASDLSEVQNVVDTTFGDGAKKINDWAKNAGDSFGLSELQAKQMTGTLGAMLKSMQLAPKDVEKMSTSMTGLAGDFASFYNISSDDAFEKIRSGISGETEPLKQLGINMSVANLEQYALSSGMKKQYKNMTQAEQAQLRYNYLMSVSKDSQGDFAKTSGSFANQQRILQMRFDSLSAEVGKNLLPIFNDLLKSMNALFKDKGFTDGIKNIFKNVANVAKTAMPALLQVAKTLIPVLMQISSAIMPVIFSLLQKLIPYIMPFVQSVIPLLRSSLALIAPILFNIIQKIIPPLFSMLQKLMPLISSGIKVIILFLLQLSSTIMPVVFNLIQMVMTQLISVAQQIMPMLISLFTQMAPLILDLITNILPIIVNLIQTILPLISQIITAILPVIITLISNLIPLATKIITAILPVMTDLINALLPVVAKIVDGIKKVCTGLIDFITGVFSGDWEKAWTGIKEIFGGIWEALVAVVKVPINLIIGMINGLVNGVVSAFNGIINAVNGLSFKVPDWVPKIGGEDFGFDLTQVSAPQIPKLATGTVVPANYGNFQAILGDNKKAPEVVSPVPTMIDAVLQALDMWGGGNSETVLRVEGNSNNPLTQLARALLPYLTIEKRRKGAKASG